MGQAKLTKHQQHGEEQRKKVAELYSQVCRQGA